MIADKTWAKWPSNQVNSTHIMLQGVESKRSKKKKNNLSDGIYCKKEVLLVGLSHCSLLANVPAQH